MVRGMAEAADAFGVKNFVLISTDKAVNPPNVMGATVCRDDHSELGEGTKPSLLPVRLGMCLGVVSVIPLFKKQIQWRAYNCYAS